MLTKGKKVLVVDDEPKILEVVASLFESKGFLVYTAENGHQAITLFERENIALVILDLMLPDISGEDVCRQIRKRSRVPVIMLTAKAEENDVVNGLEIGADDYLTKPFSLRELYAHVEAVLRRTEKDLVPLTMKNSWHDGDLIVDFEKNEVLKKGEVTALTPNEHKILAALIKYPGKVFSREELILLAMGDDYDGYDRAIDSHIKNIRKKLEDNPRAPLYILTVPGLGYKFGGD